MRRMLMLVGAALVLALPASSSAATVSVKIVAGAFDPANVTVASGDTVTWTNTTSGNHQIVSDNGTFASGTLTPGQSYSFTFKAADKYGYHDGLHPLIKGAVTVTGPPPAVTLATASSLVTYGGSTTLTGKTSTGNSGDSVAITSQPFGVGSIQQVATVTTGAGGNFSFAVKPSIRTQYTATWKTATSQPVTVQVRPKVSLTRFTTTRLFAKVRSSLSYAGHFVLLQRRTSVGWMTVRRLVLGPGSGRLFKAPHVRGTRRYRVYLSRGQAGSGYTASWSNAVRVHFSR
jgi:plastocyanin